MRLAHAANNILLVIAVLWVPECGTRHRKHAKNRWAVTPSPKGKRMDDYMYYDPEPIPPSSSTPPPPPEDVNSSESIPSDYDTDDPDQGNFWDNMIKGEAANMQPLGNDNQKMRACYLIATTYKSSLKDLRKYFDMRYFYENNIEYEVGYMTNDIISKYQRMLELFYIAQNRFFLYQDRNFAPSTYMVYLYTIILEMATVIGHLCGMLHELEEKYKKVQKSGFDDYHVERNKWNPNVSRQKKQSIQTYHKMLEHDRKKRMRLRNKLRKKNLYAGYKPTTPSRLPKLKGKRWPLHYGWSIEHW